MEFALQILLLTVLSGAILLQRARTFQLALAALFLALIVFAYVQSPDQVAQDRQAYFRWYQSTTQVWVEIRQDFLFTSLLGLFPTEMSLAGFSGWFMSSVIIVFAVVYLRLYRMRFEDYGLIALAVIFVLMGRIFIGLLFNTTRSSLAGLVFCLFLTQRNWGWRMATLLVAGNLHLGLTMILLPILAVALLVRWHRPYLVFLGVGACFFMLKIGFGFSLIDPRILQDLQLFSADTRFERGFSKAFGEVSLSQMIQFAIMVLIPAGMIVFAHWNSEKHSDELALVLRFWALVTSLFFFTYPEMLLSLRLLVVSGLLSFLLLPRIVLAPFAACKGVIIIYLLPQLV